METPKEYYYTYYSYEEWGRGYFGSRKCYCCPVDDIKYLGSSKDKTFKPTQKIILKDDYATREEAYADEIILQRYYKVVENPHFANRAYQTATGFTTYGKYHTEGWKKKLSEKWKGEKNPNYNAKENHSFYGKKHTDEWKKQQSIIRKGRRNSEESKIKQSQKMKGRTPWNKGIKDPTITRGKNPRAKKILFNDKIYECIKDAVEDTNITRHMILKTCIFLD